MNERVYDLIAAVRGPRGAALARRLFEGGASLALVNRVVMDTPRWGLGDDGDAELAEAERLLGLSPPPGDLDASERRALLALYVLEGRAAFDRAAEVLGSVAPGPGRQALAWWSRHDWSSFEDARLALPEALARLQARPGLRERFLRKAPTTHEVIAALRGALGTVRNS